MNALQIFCAGLFLGFLLYPLGLLCEWAIGKLHEDKELQP